jgi:hypothetical protein
VPLEVEVNASRSALMQTDVLNGGNAVEQRQVVYDTRGYISELLTKSINKHTLDDDLSKQDAPLLLDFLRCFGDLNSNYLGTTRAGFTTSRGAALAQSVLPISVLNQRKKLLHGDQEGVHGYAYDRAVQDCLGVAPFLGERNNIYGGISFLDDTADLVWYSTDKMFSATGVLIAGFNIEHEDITDKIHAVRRVVDPG